MDKETLLNDFIYDPITGLFVRRRNKGKWKSGDIAGCIDAKACYDRAVRLLAGIHALLYPPRFTDDDDRTWQFKSPIAEEQMQELSDRIPAYRPLRGEVK